MPNLLKPNPNPSIPNPPVAMAPERRWADLPPDLLCRIGDRLDLKCYASARGACTAWRRTLVPPAPALLVAADGDRWCPYAASLPTIVLNSGLRCSAVYL